MKTIRRFLMYGISKSLLFKIILFLVILLISKNVFAKTNDVTNKIKYSADNPGGTFKGEEIYLGGYDNDKFTVNTRYNGRLSMIEFYLSASDWDWQYNTTYTVTLNMATSDWRNKFMGPIVKQSNGVTDSSLYSNLYVNDSFRFVTQRKISFKIKTGSVMLGYLHFTIYSTNHNSIPFTGETNWNLSSITISDNVSVTPTPVPVTPSPSTPTPTPQPSNQDIINNASQNTQDIINNQNNNTTNVIDNQNQNTTDIIDNQNQNTSDQIENANQNTENIINNASQNTQDIINNQDKSTSLINEMLGTCYYNLFNIHAYNGEHEPQLTTDDNINGFRVWCREYAVNSQVTLKDFCPKCEVGKTYYLGGTSTSINAMYIYPGVIWSFGTTKTITQAMLDSKVIFYGQQNTPTCQGAIRISDIAIYEGSSSQDYTKYNVAKCSSTIARIHDSLGLGFSNMITSYANNSQNIINNQNSNQQQTNQKLDDINNSINNDNVSSGTGSDFFNNFNTQDNGGISGIITKPLVLINSLLSNNNSCNALTFGIKFPNQENKNVSFPSGCILWNNVPNNVVNIYQIFIVGFCSYYLLKRLFKDVEDLKNPDNDSVEVIDL